LLKKYHLTNFRHFIGTNLSLTSVPQATETPNIPQIPRQSTMFNKFPPTVSTFELQQFKELMAIWVYHKNLPLSIFDDGLLDIILAKYRPGLVTPSRSMLSGSLLTHWYSKSVEALTGALNYKASGYSTLVFDSWTDVNGESIINFISINKNGVFMLDSINSGTESHTLNI
jgi:hypothetical protein